MKKAAIAGSSGLIGKFLIQELIRQNREITAVGRRKLGLHGVNEVIADFNRLGDAVSDLQDADLFCTLGTTIKKAGSQAAFYAIDHDAVVSFAKWGKSRGAKNFFVVTSLGADADSKIFYQKVKGEVEGSLARIGFDSVHVFRPSLLLGPREESRTGEKVAEFVFGLVPFLFFGPFANYRPIQAETVARAMAKVSLAPLPGFHVHLSAEIQTLGRSSSL